MKSKFILLSFALIITCSSIAFGFMKSTGNATVSFYVQGNGKDWVYLSCGTELGKGGNYAVAKDSRISITGKEGDTLWDKKLQKAITTISSSMGGKTIDLKNYY
jgi:hypothetical protein